MELYTVKAGDTLWAISQRFGIPTQSIINVNGLDNPNQLIIGMDLVIPTETVNAITYTVQPRDTLWALGRRFNVNLTEIARLNNLQYPYNLFVGQQLLIPAAQIRYTVRSGDSLWAIAQRYGVAVSQIIRANNLIPPYVIYPGQVLLIGSQQPVIETLGYYNPSAAADKTAIIRQLGRYLTYLGLFDFPFTTAGTITGTIDPAVLEAARAENIAVMPVITNLRYGNFDRDLAYTVLSDNNIMNTLITNIVKFLQTYNLIGVIIDVENMAPSDRLVFTNFIQLLYQTLKRYNKLLVLNVPAKWEEWADKDWVGFFDFNALGPYIDIAAIMTYEFGWRSGPPRPTVPIDYITSSLNYTIANGIPASKLLLGLTLYGYDWEIPDTPENLARTVTLPQVWTLARRYNVSIMFDNDAMQPYIEYTTEAGTLHRVWFENARSHFIKYQLVTQYNLRGVFYWIISQPLPATWYMLGQLFTVRKL